MKVLYLDCFSGISGDMFLGALLDAGLDQRVLTKTVRSLGLNNVKLEIKKESRCGIQGTRLIVCDGSKPLERRLKDILKIIENSTLSKDVRDHATEIFKTLAEAEAEIHGVGPSQIHFHEVGAVDSLVDIIGSCAALEALGIKDIYASALPLGSGFVKSSHGQLPVPAPATLALLKGIPLVSNLRQGELVTPTGAVLLKHFCRGFGQIPEMVVESIGYGAGSKDMSPYPNLLRVMIGHSQIGQGEDEVDTVSVLETNIDDMNPQFLAHVFEILLEAGALDVYLTPLQMKDSRSGMKLSVIAAIQDQARLSGIIFRETTTLGIRVFRMDRIKLRREMVQVQTEFGLVPVKIGYKDGKVSNLSPEYKVLKELADKTGVPLKEIYFKALSSAQKKFLGWK